MSSTEIDLTRDLGPHRTTWLITFGTYGTRLPGGNAATVSRAFNNVSEPFVPADFEREQLAETAMNADAVWLTEPQRLLIESTIPAICERGDWTYRIAAAPPAPDNHHVHILLDAEPRHHGQDIRKWLKRWLTEALKQGFNRPDAGRWWAIGGSTKPVKDVQHLRNAYRYVARQRSTR